MRVINVDELIDNCKRYIDELDPNKDGAEIGRIQSFISTLNKSEQANKKCNREERRMFTPVVCVTSGDGYEKGKIYPMIGWNNGVHILRTNPCGDVVDNLFCTGGYGEGMFNDFEDSGHPSFNEIDAVFSGYGYIPCDFCKHRNNCDNMSLFCPAER